MPNFLTHHLFVQDIYLKNNDKIDFKDRRFLKGNYFYLFWGSQGPDPLFFNGILPNNGFHPLYIKKKLGNKLHHDDFKKLLSCMLLNLEEVEEENKDAIKSFIFGQYAHYLLDSTCHPFIFYFSGFDENGKLTGKYHYKHAHYEMEIDASLARRRDMDLFLMYPYVYLLKDEQKLKVINSFMVKVLSMYFSCKMYKNVYTSGVKNMISLISFVNKGRDYRKYLFFNTSLSAFRVEKKEIKDDVLNIEKKTWLYPATGEKSDLSFVELFLKAQEKLNSLYDSIKDKDIWQEEDFLSYMDDLDYQGKKKEQKMIYCLHSEEK